MKRIIAGAVLGCLLLAAAATANGRYLGKSGDWEVINHQMQAGHGVDVLWLPCRVMGGPGLTLIEVTATAAAPPYQGHGITQKYNLALTDSIDKLPVFQLAGCGHPGSTYGWTATVEAKFWNGSILVDTKTIMHSLEAHP